MTTGHEYIQTRMRERERWRAARLVCGTIQAIRKMKGEMKESTKMKAVRIWMDEYMNV